MFFFPLKIRECLLDQKYPFHSIKKLHRGDKRTHKQTGIATYRLNPPLCVCVYSFSREGGINFFWEPHWLILLNRAKNSQKG